MRQTLSSSALLAILSILVPLTSCMCYNPNGTAVFDWSPQSVYQPCSNDASDPLSTICCATNRDNPSGGSIADGFTADICLPSGLCQNVLKDTDGTTLYAYWRDYCTIADWSGEEGMKGCLKVCTGNGQHSADGTAALTPCGNTQTATKWCCGSNTTGCCSSNDPTLEMSIPVSLGVNTSTTSTSSTSTTSSTSPTSTPTPKTTPPTTSTSKLSTAAKLGIGIGTALAILLLLALLALLAHKKKKNKKNKASSAPYELPHTRGYVEAPGYHSLQHHQQQQTPSEVAGRAIQEMGTERRGKEGKYGYGYGYGYQGSNSTQKREREPVELE